MGGAGESECVLLISVILVRLLVCVAIDAGGVLLSSFSSELDSALWELLT